MILYHDIVWFVNSIHLISIVAYDKIAKKKLEKAMKRAIKQYWPLLTVAVILILVGAFFLIRPFFPGPEETVQKYLTASMQYDVDNMLFYASDYQIRELSGNAEFDIEILRKNLKDFYASNQLEGVKGEITFENTSVVELESDSDRYRQYLEKYGYKADPEKVDGLAVVNTVCMLNGKKHASYSVVAVKQGIRWYYGFIDL